MPLLPIVADVYDFVIGVDTHARAHQYAIVTTAGRVIAERSFPNTTAGIGKARDWISHTTGGAVLASIDGASSYGRRLSVELESAGYRVVEAPTPGYRRAGKDDRIDAVLAATSTLPLETDALRDRRAGTDRDALSVLLTAREDMTREKTQKTNALIALTRRFALGIDARTTLPLSTIRHLTSPAAHDEPATTIAAAEAARLATRILQLHDALAANKHDILTIVRRAAPDLLTEPGIGPVSAATIYTAWSHPGRIRSEAAFARIAGTAPKPVSSGNHQRHRLDRSGDRRLNAALHRIAITRARTHPETRAYITRRRQQGRTDRDIRRSLKRYIARHTYRLLEHT